MTSAGNNSCLKRRDDEEGDGDVLREEGRRLNREGDEREEEEFRQGREVVKRPMHGKKGGAWL